MLLLTAYLLLFFNAFALLMTTLNILGAFENKGSFFHQDDIFTDRAEERRYIAAVRNRTDLSEDQKLELVAQEELDAQADRLHEMILSPTQRRLDNAFKVVEEVI